MNPQPSLFDRAPAGGVRHADPVTSLASARAQRGGAEVAVLAAIQWAGERGLTDGELCAALPDWHGPTLISARSRLYKRDIVGTNGDTRTTGRGGREQLVWRIA